MKWHILIVMLLAGCLRADVIFSVNPQRTVGKLGDAVPFSFRLTNSGPAAVSVKLTALRRLKDYLRVVHPDGRIMKSFARNPRQESSDWIIDIAASGFYDYQCDLNVIFPNPRLSWDPHEFDVPGTYQVELRFPLIEKSHVIGSNWSTNMVSIRTSITMENVSIESLQAAERVLKQSVLSEADQLRAIKVVAAFPDEAVSKRLLELALKSKIDEVRYAAILAVARRVAIWRKELLLSALEDSAELVRATAVAGLEKYPSPQIVRVLIREVELRRERSYRAAIVVLGQIGDRTAFPILREVESSDSEAWVRQRAKESREKIEVRSSK